MSTEPQLENSKLKSKMAVRAPAGPKTPAGRRRVSLNAVKHGYYAKTEAAMQVLPRKSGEATTTSATK